ncbi:MAG: hypothetical protein K2J78_13065, partial [Muribaculaceae bacterium]|nr:hypothetical protein [Muribaculaceae bacterium]
MPSDPLESLIIIYKKKSVRSVPVTRSTIGGSGNARYSRTSNAEASRSYAIHLQGQRSRAALVD